MAFCAENYCTLLYIPVEPELLNRLWYVFRKYFRNLECMQLNKKIICTGMSIEIIE